MKSLIYVIFAALLLTSCALTDGDPTTTIGNTTLGNTTVDVDLGDGKLFGSEEAYIWGITAAQYAVFKNPMLGESMKSKLGKAQTKLGELEQEYPAGQAVDIALAALQEQCGFWCNTVAGKQYMAEYVQRAELIKLGLGDDIYATPQYVIDQLITQIDTVEASVK